MNTLFFFNSSFQDSFEINYDVFDTNLINLSIVLFVVVTFLGEAINNTLDDRKKTIISNLENSNNKVLIVKDKLNEVKLKLESTQEEMKNVYDSRFSAFTNKKQIFLNVLAVKLCPLGRMAT